MEPESGSGSGGKPSDGTDDFETLISTTDVELLRRAWRNEKAAPEILLFETHLIDRVTGQLQLMVTSPLFLLRPPFGRSVFCASQVCSWRGS